MSPIDLRWEEPPLSALSRGAAQRDAHEMLAFLREHDGQWARVYTGSPQALTTRRRILQKAGCETSATKEVNGNGSLTRVLFARLVAPEPDSPALGKDTPDG